MDNILKNIADEDQQSVESRNRMLRELQPLIEQFGLEVDEGKEENSEDNDSDDDLILTPISYLADAPF
jgi:CO dehydrogenase/acetyl-CoA synthase beta subunit